MPHLPEGRLRADAPDLRRRPGQKPGLIKAAFKVPPRAHRHEGHRVKRPAQLSGGGLSNVPGKDPGPPGLLSEFQGAYPFPDHVLIVEGDGARKPLLTDGGQDPLLLPIREPSLAVLTHVPRRLQKLSTEGALRRKKEVQEGGAALSQQTVHHFCFLRG